MSKRSSRVIGALVAAILVVVLGGVALAAVHPQLTVLAASNSHRHITVKGTYLPVNQAVCGLSGRKVYLFVDGIRRTNFGRTDAKGNYKFTRTVSTGQHTFQTKVSGRILGVHPNIRTCLTAASNIVTVRVK
jgi:hypothetical protein